VPSRLWWGLDIFSLIPANHWIFSSDGTDYSTNCPLLTFQELAESIHILASGFRIIVTRLFAIDAGPGSLLQVLRLCRLISRTPIE
jgi:hypothetical protein